MSFASEIRASFFSRPDLGGLPPRVRSAIARREWANELVARFIQLTIICMFLFIYAISPKTYPDGAFSPVPYVLGAYLVLSVIGLVWGYLREPPDWSVYVSILFDFTLLYALMVSFHIQYQQPASFILKAPALLYVFIFIAIRALRFHPKFVIAAGIAAALGWAAVMTYVIRVNPADAMLTRSYVQYLTSNSILIGAEVDKIMSILFVTAILALGVNGSNNLLITAISEAAAAADFSRFFDSSVAKGIRTSERLEAGHGERREATIVNIDIRGFTTLASRLEPPQVMAVLSAYQGRVIPLIQANGGIIDKFMGDGIMASFGINGGDRPAAGALDAAEAILADCTRWQHEEEAIAQAGAMKIGIGIASGTVNWGAVGRGDRLEMTVIGPAVNLSAKLEKHNKQLGTVCIADLRTWQTARAQGYAGALHAETTTATVPGIDDSVEIALLSLRAADWPHIRPNHSTADV